MTIQTGASASRCSFSIQCDAFNAVSTREQENKKSAGVSLVALNVPTPMRYWENILRVDGRNGQLSSSSLYPTVLTLPYTISN